ncbi:hypothetical protein PCS_01690 [Desulfocurvibacter africanus PCS]|uniref:Lipoprotein n=1 Tax=Desulfocurvibacter africanus PCS TaxID=1262666 RepID=M5Q1G2_DESAF|nr:hypothetical protein [Desulfocurvibacter africanus]EMG37551.1 hypothetical protein PCS_01690 [Desulfocurvibacter africanus PCS]
MRLLPILMVCAVACGCGVPAKWMTRYSIDPGRQSFRVETITTQLQTEDDPKYEMKRVQLVDGFVKANSLCPDGYNVFDREIIHHPPEGTGDQRRKTIIYHGRCLP